MPSVFIAENYPLFRTGLEEALVHHPNIQSVESFSTREEIEQGLPTDIPTLLILDNSFLEDKTLPWLRPTFKRSRELSVLIFSTDDRPATVKKYIQAGCRAYLLKSATREELYAAISELLKGSTGGIYLQPILQKKISYQSLGLKHCNRNCSAITKREREVLHLIIEEFTTKEIAAKLFISDCTVESHRLKLIQKMGVKNTAGLVREALQHQLYPQSELIIPGFPRFLEIQENLDDRLCDNFELASME